MYINVHFYFTLCFVLFNMSMRKMIKYNFAMFPYIDFKRTSWQDEHRNKGRDPNAFIDLRDLFKHKSYIMLCVASLDKNIDFFSKLSPPPPIPHRYLLTLSE